MESADVPVSTPLDAWLAQLAQPIGAPGGGAASGVMLGIGASLLRMVAEYTADDPRAADCADRLAHRREEALRAAESDGVVSAAFGAALALPDDDADREPRVREAAIEAARSSARLGALGAALLPELRLLDEIGNRTLVADLAVAAEALGAGIAGAVVNLRANVRTARRYDAPTSVVHELASEVDRLTAVRTEITALAARLSPDAADAGTADADTVKGDTVKGGLHARLRAGRVEDFAALVPVWRSAVDATHHFLSAEDRDAIEGALVTEYLPQVQVTVAEVDGRPVGFAGTAEGRLEMLFVDDAARGRGVGSALLARVIDEQSVRELDVNEQNPDAVAFYLRKGFAVVGRSPRDDAGRPYPILHLRRTGSAGA